MNRLILAIAAAAATALLAAPVAQAVEPLVLASVTPADGTVYAAQPQYGVSWQITGGPPAGASVTLSVSSTPATGTDGATLSDLNRVDFTILAASSTDVGVYQGVSNAGPGWWTNIPGTYYWQIHATWTEFPPYPASPIFHDAVSPIQRIVIQAPQQPAPSQPAPVSQPSLAMSSTDAAYYVRALIRLKTKRQPHNLHYACGRVATRSFRCRPSWRDSRSIYAGTVKFTHFLESGQIVAHGAFNGLRASRSCLRTHSVKRCARSVHWHF